MQSDNEFINQRREIVFTASSSFLCIQEENMLSVYPTVLAEWKCCVQFTVKRAVLIWLKYPIELNVNFMRQK